jgi:hypothetical protein
MKVANRCILAVCLLTLAPGVSLAQAPDYRTWYLAEGSTSFFEEEILIGNPNSVDAEVTITYLVSSGVTAPAPKIITVKASSRATVRVNDDIVVGAVSAIVTSTQPIVVERSMYWGGAQRLGGHNSPGVTSPAIDWYLAEGATGFFDSYILLANPNGEATNVEIAFLGPGSQTRTATFPLEARSRKSINARVDADVRFDKFSARIRSLNPAAPIIVERAMYWGGARPGGTNEVAMKQLSHTWRFAEGFTAAGYDTYFLLANPNAQGVNVRTTFFLEDGSTTQDTRYVPAESRVNLHVNSEVQGAQQKAFSVLVECLEQLPIAAERAMYWSGFREGHTVAGIIDEATGWAFAEGVQDRFYGFDNATYFLLNNASDNLVTVRATFLLEDGTGFQDTFDIGARSRYTLPAGRYLALSNQRFAAFFEASGPIVAERSVYWGEGGHASAGTPWPFPVPSPAQAPVGPAVTAIAPGSGPTTGGTDITVTGTNFRRDTAVTIGGAPVASTRVLDAQTVVVRTAPASAGAKPVVVTSFGQAATNQPVFTFVTPPPPPPPPPPASPTIARGQPAAVYCTAFASNGVCTRVATWPFPLNYYGLMQQLANERRDLLNASCREHGGNNEFMFEAVRRLRAASGSNRWGLNWKRGNTGDLSQDVVSYFYGPEGTQMEGDIRVYLIDIIGGHCGDNPAPFWIDVTDATRSGGTIGRWTTAGRSF